MPSIGALVACERVCLPALASSVSATWKQFSTGQKKPASLALSQMRRCLVIWCLPLPTIRGVMRANCRMLELQTQNYAIAEFALWHLEVDRMSPC